MPLVGSLSQSPCFPLRFPLPPPSQPKFLKSIYYTCCLHFLVPHPFLNPSAVWLLLPLTLLKLLRPRSLNAVLVFIMTLLTIPFFGNTIFHGFV